MSSVINPVGPEEPGTYWRRRILVAVAVLLVLFVAVMVIRGGGGSDPVAQPTEQPSQSVQPSESPSSSESPSGATAACSDSDIGVAVKMQGSSFTQKQDIVFQMHITNNGATDCSRNLGPKVNTFAVSSGPAAVWSSDNCLPAGDDDIKNIPAGKTYVVEATWKQDITAASCSTPLQKAQPGGYDVIAKNMDVKSDKVSFTIN